MSGSGEGTTPGRAGALRADHPWVTAAVTFAIVLAPFLAWALATPPYASPDENDHIRYAVAVASLTPVEAIPADDGQWSAELFEQLDRRALTPERIAVGWGYARLPAFYGQEGFTCFNFRSNVTAECQELGPLDGTSELVMSTRLYPKPYYAIVGLPSLVVDNSRTLFAMRAISGALAAAAITFAIMVARRRHRPMLLGIAVALTPMVWFMGASVNPNGTEIALALAWWVGLVALLDDGRLPRTRGLLVGTVIVGAGLAVVRPLSLVWLGLIAIVVMINAGLGPLRRLLADRAVLIGGGDRARRRRRAGRARARQRFARFDRSPHRARRHRDQCCVADIHRPPTPDPRGDDRRVRLARHTSPRRGRGGLDWSCSASSSRSRSSPAAGGISSCWLGSVSPPSPCRSRWRSRG